MKKKPEDDSQGSLGLPKDKPAPTWYVVPAGTTSSPCGGKRRGGSCEKAVYWIEYKVRIKGSEGAQRIVKQPVYCGVDGGLPPTATQAGRGHSHYLDCPDRGLFRLKRDS